MVQQIKKSKTPNKKKSRCESIPDYTAVLTIKQIQLIYDFTMDNDLENILIEFTTNSGIGVKVVIKETELIELDVTDYDGW